MENPPADSRPPWYHRMDDQGETPFSRAFKSSYPLLVELLLDQEHAQAMSNAEEKRRSPAIYSYWAMRHAIQVMLSGDRPRAQGNTPLMRAVCDGLRDEVELLVRKGADMNAANDKGLTTMHWVALTGRADIAELLLNNGADPSPIAPASHWPSPAGIALLMGYQDLYELLCGRGGQAR